jgi:preprotein translocase subunit SecG
MLSALFRWETLWWLMLILYVPACAGLIIIVLLQKGKGVGFAGAFGVGPGADAVFGPRASRSLPQKLTYIMAATFMTIAFIMSLLSGRLGKGVAPEKVSEDAATTNQTDLGILDDLGSGIKEEPSAGTANPSVPAVPPAESAPAAPVTSAPASEAPVTPAPGSEPPATPPPPSS